MAPDNILHLGKVFWNIRGALKLGGVVPIGTHASLVQRKSGRFLLLDACELTEATQAHIAELTHGGEAIEAILHLHPFHTLFVPKVHALYPHAKLYGTARHKRLAPELPWQPELSDQPDAHDLFAEDLDFSVPRGVELIPANENLHFSSVLAFHSVSRTLHVDDTINYVRMPPVVRWFKQDLLAFHPSLSQVLEHRARAASDFREWARALVERLRTIDNVCAAHTHVLQAGSGVGPAQRVEQAIRRIEPKLAAHERHYG
jgi:hypothetical protein